MKFSVKIGDFLNVLQPAIICATSGIKREYVDSLKITLVAKKEELKVHANNGNVAVIVSIPEKTDVDYKCESDGEATIMAGDFQNMLNPLSRGFGKSEIITLTMNGNSCTAIPQSDQEESSDIPTQGAAVTIPSIATSFGKEVTIDRNVLVNCMDRVLFAIGLEKFRAPLQYWMLRFKKSRIRAVCGDGGRFAVYEVEGDNTFTTKSTSDVNVAIHKEHNPVLQKLVGMSTADKVQIQEYARSGDADSLMNQTVITLGDVKVILIGHDPGVKWPNESKFLDRKSKVRFTIASDEKTKSAIDSIGSTYNTDIRQQNALHWGQLECNFDKKLITATAMHTMSTKRKIGIEQVDLADGTDHNIIFRCLSGFLKEVIQHTDGQNFQIELVNSETPAVVRFYAGKNIEDAPCKINDSAGVKEYFTMFFVAYNKQN